MKTIIRSGISNGHFLNITNFSTLQLKNSQQLEHVPCWSSSHFTQFLWFLLLISIAGNSIVTTVVLKKRLYKDPQFVFLLNLTVNNYLLITNLFINFIVNHYSRLDGQYCRLSSGLGRLFTNMCLHGIMAWTIVLTLNRYIAILHGLRYRSIVTRMRIILVSLAAWVLPILFGTIQYCAVSLAIYRGSGRIFAWMRLVLILTTVSLMTFVNLAVHLMARRQMENIMKETTQLYGIYSERIDVLRRQRRKTKGVLIISYMSMLVFVPFVVRILKQMTTPSQARAGRVGKSDMYSLVTDCIIHAYAALSPAIYIVSLRDLRRAKYFSCIARIYKYLLRD